MFHPDGPTFLELAIQALSSTERGYDLLAPKFDLTPFRTPDAIVEAAVACAGTVDDAIDLCCGTGAGLLALRPHCRRRLVGVDVSRGMLDVAREQLAKDAQPLAVDGQALATDAEPSPTRDVTTAEAVGGAAVPDAATADPPAPEVELLRADVLELPFEQAFDVATCFGALGHITQQDERPFLHNVLQALRPGGRFIFATAQQPSPLSPEALFSRAFNGVMRVRNLLWRPQFIMYYLTFMLPQIRHTLERAGFSVEVVDPGLEAPMQGVRIVVATRPKSR